MAKRNTTSSADYKHPDYIKYSKKWEPIIDCLEGEIAVKARNQTYLPLDNNEKDAADFSSRYTAYKTRAVFYNATARTLAGGVGQVFNKPPTVDVPEGADYLKDDPCGTGVTLEQLAKQALGAAMSLGRFGLWVDYPQMDGPVTKAMKDAGLARPVVTPYDCVDIINWRTRKVGAATKLSLVVLREKYRTSDEEAFEYTWEYAYRVLRLTAEGIYTVERIVRNESTGVVTPTKMDGTYFDEIPFVFIGIANNDSSVDEPPFYDIAMLNIAHYRNSADYEESVYMVGQPTAWAAGLSEKWARDMLGGKLRLGSRGIVPLPVGGAFGLAQVNETTLARDAMDQKEAQMIALGARLVRPSNVAKTATEVNVDKVSEVSTLAASARNTSAAIRKAFEFCGMYENSDLSGVKFELSTDFEMTRMTSQEILAVVTAWQSGIIPTEDAWDILRRAGLVHTDYAEAQKRGIVTDPIKQAEEAAKAKAVQTDNRAVSA